MTSIGNYSIQYNKKKGTIEIVLPQTWDNIRNTVTPVSNRREPTDDDLSVILRLTVGLMEREER